MLDRHIHTYTVALVAHIVIVDVYTCICIFYCTESPCTYAEVMQNFRTSLSMFNVSILFMVFSVGNYLANGSWIHGFAGRYSYTCQDQFSMTSAL